MVYILQTRTLHSILEKLITFKLEPKHFSPDHSRIFNKFSTENFHIYTAC
jgi:hypothetical protein